MSLSLTGEAKLWDGLVSSTLLRDDVVRIRHELADRARRYDWTGVLALIDRHPRLINVTRPDGRSWYAPLHQAAEGGAPVEVVRRLLEAGAFRLLPTRDGELPAEIAARNGHGHLLPSLQAFRSSPSTGTRSKGCGGSSTP